MKQLLKKCLVMVVMFTAIESYSNLFTVQTNDQTKNVTAVSIDSVNEGSLFIIKDSDGVILYNDQIKETGTYSKKFDLTNLPDGNYYFELEKQNEIRIIPIYVKANIVEILKTKEYSIIKPTITSRNDLVYVSTDSLDYQTVKMEIFYEGHDLAYSERIKDVQSLKRVYDFSNSKRGNYVIVYSSQGRIFKNSIHIK
jgi:hypothetical protein